MPLPSFLGVCMYLWFRIGLLPAVPVFQEPMTPEGWGLTFEEIWPIVQIIVSPFTDIVATGGAILLAALLLGAFVRFFRG